MREFVEWATGADEASAGQHAFGVVVVLGVGLFVVVREWLR